MKTLLLITALIVLALDQGCTFAIGPDHSMVIPLSQAKSAEMAPVALATP